jgi:hypothetical protein
MPARKDGGTVGKAILPIVNICKGSGFQCYPVFSGMAVAQ